MLKTRLGFWGLSITAALLLSVMTMGAASAAITLTGTVTNSITNNPVEGVYIEASAPITKAIAWAVTDADGKYTMDVPDGTSALVYTVTCREYVPQPAVQVTNVSEAPVVDISLVPVGVSTPRQPIAISGPKCVFLEWYANPEYNLKGYYVWRVTLDAEGVPIGESVKISDLVTGTEYSDAAVTKGTSYKYQIQALSGADRPSLLSTLSEPGVMADYLTIFTTDQDVTDSLANLFLWDFTPADVTDNKWVRIPISARSSYDVTTLGMGIPIDLPADLLNVTPADLAAGNIRVEPTGITAGMVMEKSVNADGKLIISADTITDARNLYGSGVLFDVFVQKKNVTGSGVLQLVEDTFNPGPPATGRQGVRLYDDANPPLSIDLLLESGTLYTTKQECPLHGDVDGNGSINAEDVTMMRQLYVGNTPYGDCTLKTADINMDKRVDQADMIQLQRWISGISINPPVPTTPAAKSAEASLGFALMDTKAGQPEVWVGSVSDDAIAGSTVTVPVTIGGAAPLAGFSMTVNFLAGAQGLSFTKAELATGLPASFGIASKENTSGEHGSVSIVVSGTQPTAKSIDTQLVVLTFRVGALHQANGELPVSLGAFDVTDQFGFTPRHGAPGQPTIVKQQTPDVTATVPNVVNQTQAAATTAITGAGLTVGAVTEQCSATVADGSVIIQNPAAGAVVDADSAVALVVSTGPCPLNNVNVPNVVGQTQAAATTAITGAGLTVGTVTQVFSATVASGLVVSQTPAAAASVAPGSAVALSVSKGPEPVAPTAAVLLAKLASSFAAMDTNGDGKISYAEALAVLPGLTQAVFNEVDENGNGLIGQVESGLEEAGACGCNGDDDKGSFSGLLSNLFLGGLSLVTLLVLGKQRP